MNGKLIHHIRTIVLAAVLLTALLSACVTPPPQTGFDPQSQAATQQAAIVQAVHATATAAAMQQEIDRLQTQVAAASSTPQVIVVTATPEPPTATVPPTQTNVPPTATATQVPPTATLVPPTATATATATRIPPTATPTITPTALACNLAKFEADITVPDGTQFAPGTSFTKTWRIKNTGACTWTTAYDVVFFSGDSMSAPTVLDLPGNVAPGQVIDISIPMKAPSTDGSYRGNWKLRDAGGLLFGLGQTSVPFYVDIRVKTIQVGLPLDMVATYCAAEWQSAAGKLACPGAEDDSRGYVKRVDKPTLESGYVDDEPALLMHPQMITDGVIRGSYPAIRVENGTHFRAVIGCARGMGKCNVKFQLEYQTGSEPSQPLATWTEVYDEMFRQVDVDLSSLAGKDVRFILTVLGNGTPEQDSAMWLAPRIEK